MVVAQHLAPLLSCSLKGTALQIHGLRQTAAGPRAGCRLTRCSQESTPQPQPSRRAALLAAAGVLAVSLQPRAWAEEVSAQRRLLSAPLEFLRSRQRANGGIKLLAPIKVARMRLEAAAKALGMAPDGKAYRAALSMIRSASLNCYAFEAFPEDSLETKASLIQQQVPFVDTCTFRIIDKSVTNLLSRRQQNLANESHRTVQELIRSFQLLDDVVDMAQQGDEEAASRVPSLLDECISATVHFEDSIKACLGVPPDSPADVAVPGQLLADSLT